MTFLFDNKQVFISHSSHDADVISAVDQAFDGLGTKPYFLERVTTGTPAVKKIDRVISESDALFAFFTSISSKEDTRDWMVFELGLAVARGKKIHAWREKRTPAVEVPRFLEQITLYRDFEPNPQGILKLAGEVKNAVKKLYSLF
jgi:hypothetical protein